MNDEEAQPGRPRRVWATARAVVISGALVIIFALTVGFGLGLMGFGLNGFPMGSLGVPGGVVLGAALGLGLSLRVSREKPTVRLPWILRAFPTGRAGALSTWSLTLLLLASPYALLWAGGLPPLPWSRLSVTALLAVLLFLQCARRGSFWPAVALPLWPIVTLLAMVHHYPCWQSSNAAWCGHMCDAPPEESCRPDDFGAPQIGTESTH